MASQNLAGGISRQGFDEVDRLRRLEAGDAFAGEVDDVRRRRLFAGLHHHDRLDRFAPLVVGHADNGNLGDIGMIADRAFDFGRVDVFAARDDHVLDTVVDIEIAVPVHVAGVAGAQPTLAVEGFRGGFRQIPVADHVRAGTRRDLADLARRQLLDVGYTQPRCTAWQ